MITLQNIHCFLRTQRELDDFIFALSVDGIQAKYLLNRMEINSEDLNLDAIVKDYLKYNLVSFRKVGKGKYRLSKLQEDESWRFQI